MQFTPVHQKIAEAIYAFERRQAAAFVPDLVQRLGYAAESSLTATLRIMERNGVIIIQGGGEKGRSRVAALTSRGRFLLGVGGLPLLGSIPAGPLTEAVEDGEVLELQDLFPYRDGDFLLRVRGDSMTGDGILDGDKVLLRPGIDAKQGDIAAVLVGEEHEATLKRVFFSPGQVVLRAGNPKYQDIIVKEKEVKIVGVFRGLIRGAQGTR